jgi:hypothetical protein
MLPAAVPEPAPEQLMTATVTGHQAVTHARPRTSPRPSCPAVSMRPSSHTQHPAHRNRGRTAPQIRPPGRRRTGTGISQGPGYRLIRVRMMRLGLAGRPSMPQARSRRRLSSSVRRVVTVSLRQAWQRRATRRGTRTGAAADCGCTGTIVARLDSAYYNAAVIGAIRWGGARFSATVLMNASIRAAIAAIGDDAWAPIRYPRDLRRPAGSLGLRRRDRVHGRSRRRRTGRRSPRG